MGGCILNGVEEDMQRPKSGGKSMAPQRKENKAKVENHGEGGEVSQPHQNKQTNKKTHKKTEKSDGRPH